MERPEPLSSPSAPRAKTKVGRCRRSFSRPATMPTTPSWNCGSNSDNALGGAVPSCGISRCSAAWACSCMPASTSRRWRLMPSSVCASCSAWAASSLSRHSMPSVMSDSRPAALMRGPSAKPKSKAAARRGSRAATWNSAATPQCMRPARMRFRPCATRRRLLASSLTTSATVPSATRSSSASSRGCAAASKAPRARSSARVASST